MALWAVHANHMQRALSREDAFAEGRRLCRCKADAPTATYCWWRRGVSLPPIVGGVGESHCHLLLVAWDRGALPHIRHGFSW